MGKWLTEILVTILVNLISEETIKKFACTIKKELVPKLREWKVTFIADLKARSASTGTPIDDAAVVALDALFEAFLPDNPTCIVD